MVARALAAADAFPPRPGQEATFVLASRETEQAWAREALGIEDVARAVEEADHADGRVAVARRELVGEGAAHSAEAEKDDVPPWRDVGAAAADLRKLEGFVDPPRRFSGPRCRDCEGDVPLRRALGDGHDVDARVREGGEDAGRDPRRSHHPLSHHGDDREAGPPGHGVDEARGKLVAKRLAERGHRLGCVGVGEGESDGALGRGLEDGGNREPFGVHGAKRAGRDAGHAHHPLAGDGDDRLVPHGREGLDRVLSERPPARDLRSRSLGVMEGADVEDDAASGEGDEGAGMQDLGAVVRDLGRLAVVELRDEARVGHGPRVGREDARHVLPEDDTLRAQAAAQHRGRQVRAAAAERRQAAVGPHTEEAGDDRRDAATEKGPEEPDGAPPRGGELRRGVAVVAIGHDDVDGVHVDRTSSRGREGRGQELARETFATGQEEIAGPRGHLTQRSHRTHEVAVLASRRIRLGQQEPPCGASPTRGPR